MNRRTLKCGGSKQRRKAIFGADGAIMAAATLAAAGISAGATAAAAKSQSKAITESAKTQAQSIKDQTANSNALQKESINFTRQQNQENRQQQQDIQTTLQMLAGQQNTNDRMAANKLAVKLGGRPKKLANNFTPFYGGANNLFKVTDGGGVLPISIDTNGYGLYELYGNDHEHYHKTSGGKRKTGVGIKFNNGSVVEGEGNQNTNQGELLYVTPNDAVFISKHSIDGFNPTEAVKQGVHPINAFNIQETLKARKGLNDDGSRRRRSLGGFDVLNDTSNISRLPSNSTGNIAGGIVYGIPTIEKTTSSVAKCGKRISLKRSKAKWGDYAGATYSSAGNLIGSGITALGSMYAANKLGKAYNEAGDILATAYGQLKGIDLSELNREDYEAPHTLAVVRTPNTNINPQLERIRRDAVAQKREINRGTLSSAARQQRLAATDDRTFQRLGEQYAYKDNADETIKQGNAERITQTAQANADRDVQARKDYANQRLALLQYNNDIENQKISGAAQARADALTQSSTVRSLAYQSAMQGIGNAVGASGNAFASAYTAKQKYENDFFGTYSGLGNEQQVTAAITKGQRDGDWSYVNSLLNKYKPDADGNFADKTQETIYNRLRNAILNK